MLKRILSALLLSAMLTASFAACAQNDTPAQTTAQTSAAADGSEEAAETSAAELSAYDALPDTKYDGRTFTVTTPEGGTRYLPSQVYVEEETGEIIADAAFTRNQNVMDRFDIDIKHVSLVGNDFYSNIHSSILAGDSTYDLAGGHMSRFASMAVEPLFLDVSELPYVDLGNPWYPAANKALNIGGKQSLMFSDYTCITLSCTYGMFYNADMAAKFNVPDIQQIVLDDKWTFDKLLDYTKGVSADLDGDGEWTMNDRYANGDFFAHTSKISDTSVVFQYGMGVFTTEVSDDGEVELTLMNEKLVSVVEKIFKLYYEEDRSYHTTVNKEGAQLFQRGQMLFLTAIIMHAENYMRSMEDDYKVITIPKYDEAQEEYYTTISMSSSFLEAVPMTAADPEFASVIYDALAYEGYKNVIPAFFETAMKVKYARDDISSQMFDLLRDSTKVDFGLIFDGGAGMSTLISGVLANRSTDVASAYAMIENRTLQQYEDIITALNDR